MRRSGGWRAPHHKKICFGFIARSNKAIPVRFLASSVLLLGMLVMVRTQSAGAYPAEDTPVAPYYYLGTTNTTDLLNLGCSKADSDNAEPSEYTETVLDFGGQLPDSSGTKGLSSGVNFTNSQISDLATAFAQGYEMCYTGQSLDYIVLSTNNSYTQSTIAGETWLTIVDQAETEIQSDGLEDHVFVVGGSDIEPAFGDETDTLDWTYAYSTNSRAVFNLFYFTGSADGCPTTLDQGVDGACDNPSPGYDWDQLGLDEAANNVDAAYSSGSENYADGQVLPQIYYEDQAEQWGVLSGDAIRVGDSGGSADNIQGPTDEYPRDGSTFSSTEAYSALGNALDADAPGTSVSMSGDLEVQSSTG